MTDIVVVGGGPIGLRFASESAKAGLDVLVLEEHKVIGKPVQCAGLVSPRVIEMTDTKSVVSREHTSFIHPPEGEPLKLESAEPKAVIIERTAFDRSMASKAVEAGVEMRLGATFLDSEFTGEERKIRYKENGKTREISSRLLIGADGPFSRVRKTTGLPEPREYLAGLQAVIGRKAGGVEIFLGKDITPDFFGWSIPHPSGSLVGVASSDGNAFKHLDNLLVKLKSEKSVFALYAGVIPIGRLDSAVEDGVMLIGDAACQIKPLSGGGLYPGLKSADYCCDVAVKCLKGDKNDRESMREYDDLWQADIGKEISKGLWLRRLFKGFKDKDLNNLISALKEERVKSILENRGDIDYPSTLTKPVLKASPKLLKFAGPLIKNLFQPGK
ncbi:MAG: NAD(P)/FAD-dependent oxidoreductase [Thermoplasmata archaeon]